MPKTICSCSMGKDSLATVILALMHHEPLDEIVYCEVMFDKEISGEVPEHRTFIYETAIPWLRRAGLNVKILRANTTYVVLLVLIVSDSLHLCQCAQLVRHLLYLHLTHNT